MNHYLNLSNDLFEITLNSDIYVDKSEIINFLNKSILTSRRFICLSRPRRFGKSVTAQMLCSYYSKCLNSSSQFENLKISSFPSYRQHLNQYDVIFINMSDEFGRASHNCRVND